MRKCSRGTGFTLIELVLAVFVFAVGALGLAATTAVLTRTLRDAAAREAASRTAAARIETLRGLSCSSARSGSESVQGVVSSWTVTADGNQLGVTETVAYSLNGLPRSDSYDAVFRCRP